MEADFDTLLKGESLTGDGAWVEKPAADTEAPKEEGAAEAKEEEVEEGYKDLDAALVETEVK